MESRIVYEASKQDLIEAIKEVISGEVEERVYSRFSNRLIGSKTVCEVLGISNSTLFAYIKEKRVKPINPDEGTFKFDLAEILRLDIKKFARVANLKYKRM